MLDVTLPLATDWAEVLVPPVWSAVLVLILLLLAWALRKPLTRALAAMGVSRLSVMGVDVEWITNQAGNAYRARDRDTPAREELRAFALLGVRLKPLIQGRRILWIDDLPAIHDTEALLLRRLGVDVENALSTEEGMERLRRDLTRFDLIVSDWTRGSNEEAGPELLASLAGDGIGLPVLMYVGEVSAERRAQAGRARRESSHQRP